jgi:ATP-dependent Clp protease ATP-binding subunit ClpC
MAFITLHIPTLVQDIKVEEKPHFYLRPLFINFPVATNRRYEQAVSQYKKEIKHFFKGYVLSRANSEQLLWFLFKPEIQQRKFHFAFNIGKQFIEGDFLAATFELKDKLFIFFPALRNYMFIGKPDENGRIDIEGQAREAARQVLKQIKDDEEENFQPEAYFSGKREMITTVSVNVHIEHGPFKFEEDQNSWIFARFNHDIDFNGAVEIEKVGYDLNSRYPFELTRAYYQDALVDNVYRILFRNGNTPLALVGPPGVGKHSVVHEAVWRYQGEYYEKRKGEFQRVWHIDPGRIITGMSIVGMWQKRLEAIIRFLQKPGLESSHSDNILIDNPVALLRIGKSASNSMTMSDVFKPYLEKRLLQLTVLATAEEWKILQEKDRRFTDLFQVIRMQEPDQETAVRIILQQRRALESANDTVITIQAVNQLLAIQRNYMRHKPLPGSVINLMQQLAVKYRYRQVDAPEVREEFKTSSGLEEHIFDSSRQLDKDEVRNLIGQELVGQPQAIETLSNIVHLIKAKLPDKNRPISSLMFIGPTGVGKTQAAKVLCQFLMGSEEAMMRFDMNEYIDDLAVHRLIGDYYNPEGQLTGKVRYRPFGILLFDEIEKAHPKVHDLLLQVLDDGRLTDSLGRTVDFTNTIIIMTSNVGAREASSLLGYRKDIEGEASIYRKAVELHFRPEFINRIDQIVIFNPLELDHILGIARLQIKELLQRDGFVRRTTILNISKDALEWVARRGFDARMGGRALKRQIEKDLTTLTAEQLISTHTDNPIIFNILLKDGRLFPEINVLDFVEPLEEGWIPELPDASRGSGFYQNLIRSIEALEKRIARYEESLEKTGSMIVPDEELDWQYYDFKNKVVETKETIRNTLLGFRDRYYAEAPAIPLRLKRGNLISRKDWTSKGVRENFKDRLFQQEGLKEIRDAYQYGATQFDSSKTEFIKNYLDTAFLYLSAHGFLQGIVEEITLHFESCITGLGDREIEFMMELYSKFLKMMDLSPEVFKDQKSIRIEGHSPYEMLKGEEGVHLFYVAHQNPLPIRLRISRKEKDSRRRHAHQVIRIYDGTATLTDLRTGFSNAVNITPEEFKLLVFAGVNPDVRKEIRPF